VLYNVLYKTKHIRNMSKATGTVAYLLCCLLKPKHLEKINTVLFTFDFEWEEVQNKIHPCAITKMKPWPKPTQYAIRKLNHNNRWPDIDDSADCVSESKILRKDQSRITSNTVEWSGIGSIHLSEMKCFLSLNPGSA